MVSGALYLTSANPLSPQVCSSPSLVLRHPSVSVTLSPTFVHSPIPQIKSFAYIWRGDNTNQRWEEPEEATTRARNYHHRGNDERTLDAQPVSRNPRCKSTTSTFPAMIIDNQLITRPAKTMKYRFQCFPFSHHQRTLRARTVRVTFPWHHLLP